MDNDYQKFVDRMGSFEDTIDLDSGEMENPLIEESLEHSGKDFVDGVALDDDELKHYGILGMKWGVRKDGGKQGDSQRSNKASSKQRMSWSERKKQRKVDAKKLDAKKADYIQKNIKSVGEKTGKKKEMDNHLSEAKRLAGKYDFDQDDGGGGITKKDQDAGYRYLQHHMEAEFLDQQITSIAINEASKQIAQEYSPQELKKLKRSYAGRYAEYDY